MGRDDQLQDFQRFNFDADERFKAWLKTVEYTNDSPATLQKLKAKWYKKTIDVNFDAAWLASVPPSARSQPAADPPRTSSFSSQPSYTQSSNTARQSSAPPPPPRAAAGPPVGSRLERWVFMYHVALVALTVAYFIPIIPVVSARSYHMFWRIAVLGQGLKVYMAHDPASLRPFSWANLQRYLAQVAPSSEFHFLVVAFALLTAPPILIAMIPLTISAAYAVATRLASTYSSHPLWQRYGARIHALMMDKQRDALMTATWAELGVAAVLVMNLFGRQRNFMMVFAYSNLLKMRYHMGDTAAQHRMAWYTVAQKTAGVRARLPPVVNGILQKITSWFLSVR